MVVAVSVWLCIASTVTTAPSMSRRSSRSRTAGISLLLAWNETCLRVVVPHKAATWFGAGAGAGASQGLAVQGDDPQPVDHGQASCGRGAQHLVEQLRGQAGDGTAKGRLVSCSPAHTQGGEYVGGGIGGPMADRGEPFGSGQGRADRYCDQCGQSVASPAGIVWVGHTCEDLEEVVMAREGFDGEGVGMRQGHIRACSLDRWRV